MPFTAVVDISDEEDDTEPHLQPRHSTPMPSRSHAADCVVATLYGKGSCFSKADFTNKPKQFFSWIVFFLKFKK